MRGLKVGGQLAGLVIVSLLAAAVIFLVDILLWPFYISVIVLVVAVIALTAFAASINGAVSRYKLETAEALKNMAKGNFDLKPDSAEQDELVAALTALSAGLKKFTDDISQAAKKFDGQTDERNYDGAYREAAKNINLLISTNAKDLNAYTEAIQSIAKGDYRNNLAKQTGQKEMIYDAVDALAAGSKTMASELAAAKKAAADTDSMLKELHITAERMGRGEFNASVNVSYRGEFAEIFKNLEQASALVSGHNKEMIQILEEMARYTPGRSSAREYGGSFVPFKQAVSDVYDNIAGLTAVEKEKPKVTQRTITPRPAAAVTSARPGTAAVASNKASPVSSGNFVDAKPNLGNRTVKAPSAAKVYDAKDFGKY